MPRPNSSIIHEDFLTQTGRWTKTVTIQRPTSSRNEVGEEILDWDDHLEDVPCAFSVFSIINAAQSGFNRETRTTDDQFVSAKYVVDAEGSLDITEKDRAIVDEVAYAILLVEKDSQGTFTRLTCEVVT